MAQRLGTLVALPEAEKHGDSEISKMQSDILFCHTDVQEDRTVIYINKQINKQITF